MAEIQVKINNANTFKRQKDWKFNEAIPNEKFSEFKCKYFIQTDDDYLTTMKKQHGSIGYIRMSTENYSFDEYVNVVV